MTATAEKPTVNGTTKTTGPKESQTRKYPTLTVGERARIHKLVFETGSRLKAAQRLKISSNSLSRLLNDKDARVRRSTRALIRQLPSANMKKRTKSKPAKIQLGPPRETPVKTPPIFARLIREIEQCQKPLRDQLTRIETDIALIKTHLGV